MREDYLGTTLTTNEWIEVLQDKQLTQDNHIAILQALYSFEGHQASASQLGLILGYKGKSSSSPLNAQIGHFGKKVAAKYAIRFSKREDGTERKWDIFFNGWKEPPRFIWQLKMELSEALTETGLTGVQQFAEEIPESDRTNLIEGAKRTIIVNTYERNPIARQLCIEHYKPICQVCDFDFEKKYGEMGKNFIHVHHLTRISDIRNNYEVDPIIHLRPVCPNCHAMIHRHPTPLTIEELKHIIENLPG